MESWMGPWSADLPDVSPPEKQLACQRARLYLNTHSNMLRSCMRALKQNLWFEVMVSYVKEEDEKKREGVKRGEQF